MGWRVLSRQWTPEGWETGKGEWLMAGGNGRRKGKMDRRKGEMKGVMGQIKEGQRWRIERG